MLLKIPDITDVATNTTLKSQMKYLALLMLTNASLNVRINEVKNEIPSITNLAITTALTVVENKIPDHSKYIITRI